jgi:hypothetical protein
MLRTAAVLVCGDLEIALGCLMIFESNLIASLLNPKQHGEPFISVAAR